MRSKSRVRKTLRALGSLGIVSAVALYAVYPTKEALSLKVTSGSAATASYQLRTKSASTPKGPVAVVYGSVKGTKGQVPKGGSVSLSRSPSHQSSIVKVALGTSGTFYAVVRAPGLYKVVVRAEFASRWYQTGKTVRMSAGRSYDVSAVLRIESVFTMLPVSSY
jgi:hypothetical protein